MVLYITMNRHFNGVGVVHGLLLGLSSGDSALLYKLHIASLPGWAFVGRFCFLVHRFFNGVGLRRAILLSCTPLLYRGGGLE